MEGAIVALVVLVVILAVLTYFWERPSMARDVEDDYRDPIDADHQEGPYR